MTSPIARMLKKILLPLVLVFCCSQTYGQIDSLKNQLESEQDAKKKFDLFIEIGHQYRSQQIDSAIYFHQEALSHSDKALKSELNLCAENEIAYNKVLAGELDQAKSELISINAEINAELDKNKRPTYAFDLQKSLALNYKYQAHVAQKQDSLLLAVGYFEAAIDAAFIIQDLDILSKLFDEVARTHYMLGAFPRSLDYCLKGIRINKTRGDKKGVASSTGNAGILFKEMGEFESALEYFQLALSLNEELGHERSIAINLGNIGVAYDKLEQYDLAYEYFNRAAKMHQELGSTEGLIYNFNNMALIHQKREEYQQAIDFFEKALNYSLENENHYTYAHTCIYLGGVYKDQQLYSKAQNYLDLAGDYCKKVGALDLLSEYYELQSVVYEKTGKYALSLENFKKYTEVKDSILNENNLRKVFQLENNYKMDQRIAQDSVSHAKEILLHQAESDQRKAELKAARLSQFGLVIGLLFLFGFVILIYKRFHTSKKQNRIILQQKEELHFQKDQVETQKEALESKQKEIVDSINYAKRIQTAILPPMKLFKSVFPESFILYKPKDIVAGDFYWLEKKDDLIFVAAADCTGHGVPGAMVSVICHSALNRSVRELKLTEPGEILDATKKMVIEEFEKSEDDVRDGMDICLCVIKPDANGGASVKMAGANNALLVIRKGTNIIEEIKADRQPVGKHFIDKPFTTTALTLNKGDQIYLSTDGYYDQFGGVERKKFKVLNFRKLLIKLSGNEPDEQMKKLDHEFETWRGEYEQIDDVCVMGIRI